MDIHEKFMSAAIDLAKKAARKDEVPVGAVIVRNNKIIAKACNLRETKKNPLAHAELLAINKAAKRMKGWRLLGCTLYVTLEPCSMCAGAIINARVEEVVFGAYDPQWARFTTLPKASSITCRVSLAAYCAMNVLYYSQLILNPKDVDDEFASLYSAKKGQGFTFYVPFHLFHPMLICL